MAQNDFFLQLQQLGYPVEKINDSRLAFSYRIPVGRLAETEIKLGFDVAGDFPLTPPTGPHVSPQLLPLHPEKAEHPVGGIHKSDFGADWQYWSRPFEQWNSTERTVRAYLAHIRHLFETL